MEYAHMKSDDLTYDNLEEVRSLLDILEAGERDGYADSFMPQYNNTWVRSYSGNNLIVAIEAEKIVGVIDYHANDNVCTINELVVSPDYQRKGIANEMWETFKIYLKANTWVDVVKLSVRANNAAIEFYKKVGFNKYQVNMFCKLI